MKRIHLALAAVALIVFIWLGLHNITTNQNKLKLKDIQLKSTSANLKQLELKYDNLNIELDKVDKTNQQQIQDLDKQKQELQQQLDKAQKDLQARAAEKQRIASLSVTAKVYAAPAGCTDAKSCIYMHESGNRTTAVNSIGCRGLGQACPGSKLPCGDDYACQDAYFTNYANARYGGWDAAWAFWQQHSWW